MSAGLGVGIGSNIVGGEMQGWAAQLDREAMARAFQAEMAQQNAFRQQGMQQFQQGLAGQGYQSAQQLMQQGAQNRMNTYGSLAGAPMGFSVSEQGSKSGARDAATVQQAGQARANLGAYGDWQQQAGVNSLVTQRLLNQLASTASGQASLYPYQMYQAQHEWDPLAMAGAAISGLGGAAGNYMQYAQQPQGRIGAQGPYGTPYGTVMGVGQYSFNPYAQYANFLGQS